MAIARLVCTHSFCGVEERRSVFAEHRPDGAPPLHGHDERRGARSGTRDGDPLGKPYTACYQVQQGRGIEEQQDGASEHGARRRALRVDMLGDGRDISSAVCTASFLRCCHFEFSVLQK